MRILANENFPGDAVTILRQKGHDVVWVRTDAPGSDDRTVLQRAQLEERILVTFDKDFGELAFRFGLPAASGIILFRVRAPSAEYIARAVTTAIESRSDWAGHFVVVEEGRIRMVPLGETKTE
jgi:predicted nuclease of predicted toxin-antitoxin system